MMLILVCVEASTHTPLCVHLTLKYPPLVCRAHTAGVDYLGRRLGNLWHLFREKKVASMVLKEYVVTSVL